MVKKHSIYKAVGCKDKESYEDDKVTDIVKVHHREQRCQPVKYALCDQSNVKVPAVLVQRVYAPILACAKVIKNKDGTCAKLCQDVVGWELCSKTKHQISALLTNRVYTPHFIEKDKCEKEYQNDNNSEDDDEESQKSVVYKKKKNNRKY